MTRTITAYFDDRSDAQLAADRLADAGISRAQATIHDSSMTDQTTTAGDDKGFWASLADFFMPNEDRYAYSEGIRRGGSVLTVRAEDGEFNRVSDILEQAGAVDMDGREAEWRSQGWSGYDGSALGGTTAGPDITASTGRPDGANAAPGARANGTTGSGSGAMADEDYIPEAEEQLRVGKREVDHGRVRIRSYVHDEPVEEHVPLRSETVDVERSPVNRAATSQDRLFEERTIEAEEHDEEPVVSKEARVKEEVRLRKHAEERDETVRDTVRRTDVEVEDERTGERLSDEERRRGG